MISEMISKLNGGCDLSYVDAGQAMADMLSGNVPDNHIAEFLVSLSVKGETDDELLGMLDKMRKFAVTVEPPNMPHLIDMCGTGGDKLDTFNISTTASFVVAAAGGAVAKHGNRSSSGASGSADIFEYLGCNLDWGPTKVLHTLEKHNIAFMFAQRFHPAMKNVAAARKLIPGRTVFNMLGPLSNPAGVKNQLVGVSSDKLLYRIPEILKRGGSQNVMTVHSENGMDEFSTCAGNNVCHLNKGKKIEYSINPTDVGLHMSVLHDIQVNTKKDAMTSFVTVLRGTASRAMLETVALNAAAGLVVGGITKDIADGVELALGTMMDGSAFKLLERFVADAGDPARLVNM